MSQDGADLGYTPEQGMRGAMGGEQPKADETITDLAAYLDSAPEKPESYDDAARICGSIMLAFLREHPDAGDLPVDDEPEWDVDGDGQMIAGSFRVKRLGLYSTIKDTDPDAGARLEALGLSGFQVGWAANAARTALGLSPVANPAIVTVGGGS